MRGWLRRWGAAAFVMILIFAASSIPDLPQLPGGVSDKTGHVLAYAVLAAAWLRGAADLRWQGVGVRSGTASVAGSAAYGVLDELHQWFVPGRVPSVADWLADVTGAVAAVLMLAVLGRVLGRSGRAV